MSKYANNFWNYMHGRKIKVWQSENETQNQSQHWKYTVLIFTFELSKLDEHASSSAVEKIWLFQINFSNRNVQWRLIWCDSCPGGSFSPFKLGGDGEAGCGVLPHVEAQQGEDYCNAAVHDTSLLVCSVLDILSWEEEEEEEKQGEKIEGSAWLPPTPGGWKRLASE